jgi:redox-sensitive bicupin YhaK (pirin superfamily)
MTPSAERSVERVLESTLVMEGAEFPVHRCFPTRKLSYLDPFLLLNEMGLLTLHHGFPEHPHKAFETVTYMLEGHGCFGANAVCPCRNPSRAMALLS